MGIMIYSLLWVMQDLYYQPYRLAPYPTKTLLNPYRSPRFPFRGTIITTLIDPSKGTLIVTLIDPVKGTLYIKPRTLC